MPSLDGQGADAAVRTGHAGHAGESGGGGHCNLRDARVHHRRGTCSPGSHNQLSDGAAAADSVAASPNRSYDILKPGQNGAFHCAGHGSAGTAVPQLRRLIVHHVPATVIVLCAIHILIAGAAIVVPGRGGGKAVIRRKGRNRHGQRRHGGQCQSREFSNVLQMISSFCSVGSNACQSPGRSRRMV